MKVVNLVEHPRTEASPKAFKEPRRSTSHLESQRRFRALFLVCAYLIPLLLIAAPLLAERPGREIKARYASQSASGSLARIELAPLQLQGGSRLTFISPVRWVPVTTKLSNNLRDTHRFFTDLLGEIPAFSSSIRLMDEETFYATTGAPRWTNAMYYKGEIIIPLSFKGPLDLRNIARSLKHEYTHAIINALSNGKCPGWLDEGLAQWAEGDENPALRPALNGWLSKHRPISLGLLQGGFTKLDSDMVPAAYAQSLFASNTMLNTFGFKPIRNYLDKLRDGMSRREAFAAAFNLDEQSFEARLGGALKQWNRELSRKNQKSGSE
ncbi:MAG: hypothetical protein K1X83_02170 [Oligoflexia bacterium]|nr:hypothetical protein [Oligoflexia bacterium]